MVTTDQSGCSQGYSFSSAPYDPFDAGQVAGNASCNYTNSMNGTSSATPTTVGVVALMLEANPGLTWRDVKHLLAGTARKIDPSRAPVTRLLLTGGGTGSATYTVEPGWTTNGAGYHFHNWYGFGLLDADAAVSAAVHHAPGQLGTQRETPWLTGSVTTAAIPDFGTPGAGGSRAVDAASAMTVEAVQVRVTLTHARPGDLGIALVSPSGTRSVLLNAFNGFGSNPLFAGVVQLASNAFYGEPSQGTWQLEVVDAVSGTTGTLDGWKLRVYGR